MLHFPKPGRTRTARRSRQGDTDASEAEIAAIVAELEDLRDRVWRAAGQRRED